MKTLILGLGNPILSDDGVGLCVVNRLKSIVKRDDVTIAEAEVGGMNLLELITGYDKAILVDAIQTPNGFPGCIYRLTPQSLKRSRHIETTHGLDFTDSLELGHKLNMPLPKEIIIFAIEASDISTFSEECTSLVKRAIPICADRIAKII